MDDDDACLDSLQGGLPSNIGSFTSFTREPSMRLSMGMRNAALSTRSLRSNETSTSSMLNSMPSLATIGHDSVLTDVSWDPMMSDFFESGMLPRRSVGPILRDMPTSLPIYNILMQQDNCAGRTLDDLAPAAILLNAKEPDKQMQRWQTTNDASPGVVTRKLSICDQSWVAKDSAPSTANRRSYVEVPQVLNTHQPFDKPFDNTPMAAPRGRSSQEVVPLAALVECTSDTMPMPAQRRTSSPSSSSHTQLVLDVTPDIAPVVAAQRRTSSASTISLSPMPPPRLPVRKLSSMTNPLQL